MDERIDIESIIDKNEYLNDINRKEIPIGSVVYFLENSRKFSGRKAINFGIVEEHYPNTIVLHLIEPLDMRRIYGIPVKDFKTPTRWQKLPKGWSYNTQLFTIELENPLLSSITMKEANQISQGYPFGIDIRDKERILQLYKEGRLVNVEDNDHAHFESEINKRYGWRIIRKYPITEHHPYYISVDFRNVFTNYAEAKAEVDKIDAEIKRKSELSEYDWTVELIDEKLDLWAGLYYKTNEEKQKCRDWLLSRDNVEDIEVRIAHGGIQWKYLKNKKWLSIVV